MKKNKTILIASSSMMAAGVAHGAIVYTYVNQSYDPASSGYNLDLDGNGTADYKIFFDANNSTKPCVLGTFTGSGSSYPGSFPNPTPYVLNELDMNAGYPANPNNNENNGLPVMTFGTPITSQTIAGAYSLSIGDPAGDKYGKNEGYLHVNGDQMQVGQWPSSVDTVGYVGLVMVDNSVSPANTNYGWVHLDLNYTQLTAELTVIDYAYQTIANSNILAGDAGFTNPVIIVSPTNQTLVAGSTVTMNVYAFGNPTPAYQWMSGPAGSSNYTNVPNAGNFFGVNTPTLVISNVVPADQLDYVVVLTNIYSSTNSPPATLTVNGAGVAGPAPSQQFIYAGFPAQFTVTDLGGGTITNQWQFKGANLSNVGVYSGATTTNLLISSVNSADAGNYQAFVSTPYGSVPSSVASLGIVYPDGSLYESNVLAFGAVDYYRLDETSGTNAWDFIGGKNGTYGPDAVLGAAGPTAATGFPGFASTNYAATFFYSDPNDLLPLLPWNLDTNTITITAWIYPNPAVNENNGGIVFYANTNNMVCGIRYDGGYGNTNGISDGNIGYNWGNVLGTYDWNSGITAPHNQWSLVALAVSPTNATLYIYSASGLQSATNYTSNPPVLFNGTEYIGTYPEEGALGNNNFVGNIDEVAIFPSTLSPYQIMALYDAGLNIVLPPPPSPITISSVGTNIQLQWTGGTLLQATNLLGPWMTNTTAKSPYTVSPTNAQEFFRTQ